MELDIHDKIFNNSKYFFWTLVKKYNKKVKINELIEYLNNINSKSFTIIDNNCESLLNPFIYKYDNEYYIFFEKSGMNKIGEIYYSKILEIDDKISFTEPKLVLSEKHNLSCPQIINQNENIYMLPIQINSNKLDIYICKSFPEKWEYHATLLVGNYLNSTVFKLNNFYFLFIVELKENKSYENIYYNSDMLSKWKFMKTLNITDQSTSRNGAGNIFILNDKIYRPLQNNKNYFGEGIDIYEINIDPNHYDEKYIGSIKRNIHMINFLDNYIVADTHNKNKNFFENNYKRIIDRFNTKNNRILQKKIYEDVGNYLRNKKSKKVLDIGFEYFNIFNKSYFKNENIDYYQIDIKLEDEYKKRTENIIIIDSILILNDKNDYDIFFDIIMSFGVLGWVEFSTEEIEKYLLTCYNMLTNDGIFYLKIDKKHMETTFKKKNIVTDDFIYKLFKDKVPKNIIDNQEFIFYVLEKK